MLAKLLDLIVFVAIPISITGKLSRAIFGCSPTFPLWAHFLTVESYFCNLSIKIDNPKFLNDYRSLSLCNFSYKLIAKIVVGRIKKLHSKLVSKEQEVFVPGKNISYNIVLVQKILYNMCSSVKDRKLMGLKVDNERAYDLMNMDFV